MDTVFLPYKLQVYISQSLREHLKTLAREQNTSLQKLVPEILESYVLRYCDPDAATPRARRDAAPVS